MKSFLALIALGASLFAGLTVGQPFPKTVLEDQFEKEQQVLATDTLVLVSFERDVSSAVNDFLNAQSKTFLADHNTKYISDISGMPGIISKLFALPKMRDYNYSLMLNRDDDFKEKFDAQEGKLTVYTLKEGAVVSVTFIDPTKVAELFEQ